MATNTMHRTSGKVWMWFLSLSWTDRQTRLPHAIRLLCSPNWSKVTACVIHLMPFPFLSMLSPFFPLFPFPFSTLPFSYVAFPVLLSPPFHIPHISSYHIPPLLYFALIQSISFSYPLSGAVIAPPPWGVVGARPLTGQYLEPPLRSLPYVPLWACFSV